MRILQFCHKPPYPPNSGGSIAMNSITQTLLKEGHSVTVWAIESPNHRIDENQLNADYQRNTNFQSFFVDTTPKAADAVRAGLHKQTYRVERYYTKELANKLIQLLQEQTFDIIQLETPYTTPYIDLIRKYSSAKIVFRPHKIEHLSWARIAQQESNLWRKLFLQYRIQSLKNYERELGGKIDACIAVSDFDDRYFSKIYTQIPCQVIPVGLNIDDYEIKEEYLPSANPTLFNLSSWDVLSNVEGAEWFFQEVWPLILKNFPDTTMHIAGKNIPEDLQKLMTRNVVIEGEVSSANDFMQTHDIMIVPLLTGSGVPVKILEGMALGKTVITTSAGAESLRAENGKQLLVADTPQEFVSHIGTCIQMPDICAFIGENARNFVALQHNNDLIVKQLIKFYNTLLAR
ncbi:MAG: glycosyltransferase family 4 protein [Bacteroidales bacterium]|nr:glycosyltransferase family 4 protein [Bacteroidales bacterium]